MSYLTGKRLVITTGEAPPPKAIPDGELADDAAVTGAILKQWANQHAQAFEVFQARDARRMAIALLIESGLIPGAVGGIQPTADSVPPGFVFMDTADLDKVEVSDGATWLEPSAENPMLTLVLIKLFNQLASRPTLTQMTAALAAQLVSPAFTGTPTAPTAAPGTSNNQLSTTAFVTNGIASAMAALPAANLTGTIDPARLPPIVGAADIVAPTDLSSLTTEQQAEITGGRRVFTPADGLLRRYSGSGSKTDAASYLALSDASPALEAVVGLVSALALKQALLTQPGDVPGLTAALADKQKVAAFSYAALMAIAPSSRFDGMVVRVAARATNGDHGGGLWQFRASSTATADGGTVLAPDSGTGRWHRLDIVPLRIEWFASIQAALDASYALKVPVQVWKRYAPTVRLTIRGDYSISSEGSSTALWGLGDSTGFDHGFDDYLFHCPDSLPSFMSFRDFKVISTSPKTANSQVFYFAGGLARSEFVKIRVGKNASGNECAGLFNCLASSTTDTLLFDDCHIEGNKFIGIGIARGSHVIFRSGRIIGHGASGTLSALASFGVKFHGGNGGVVFESGIDLINLFCAVDVTNDNGFNNREVTFGQSYIDSSFYGLRASDASTITCNGLESRSCGEANIQLTPSFTGSFFKTGGECFNAGAVTGGAGHGIWIRGAATYINIANVTMRNNAGTAIKADHASIVGTLTGNRITNNGTGFHAKGKWNGGDNLLTANTTANLVRNDADLTGFCAGKFKKKIDNFVTGSDSLVTLSHNLGIVPVWAEAKPFGDYDALYKPVSWTDLTVTFKIVNHANVGLGATDVPAIVSVAA